MSSIKSVKGIVQEAASGKPVSGAMIMITEGSYEHPDIASQSDEEGVFYLPEIRIPGTYTLLIRHNNQSKTISVQVSADSVLHVSL